MQLHLHSKGTDWVSKKVCACICFVLWSMESYKCGPVTYIGCYEIWILHILSVSLMLKTMGKWRAWILIEAGWRDIRGYLLVHLPALGHEWATPTCFLASWQLFNLLLRTSDGDGSSCCWEFNSISWVLLQTRISLIPQTKHPWSRWRHLPAQFQPKRIRLTHSGDLLQKQNLIQPCRCTLHPLHVHLL